MHGTMASATESGPNPSKSLPDIGEAAGLVAERFDHSGVLAVMLLDASVLHTIERRHGDVPRYQALASLAELVQEVGQERLDVNDLVVTGEVGRSEVLVLFFREVGSAAFFRTEMPSFAQSVKRALHQRGGRVFYPYFRGVPRLWAGSSVAIRNPKLAANTQLRRLIEEARADAEWSRQNEKREQRRLFTELLLDRRVHSVYEPIVDVHTRTVFGYEALARGPEGTDLHAPVALFGAAEDYDLVYELDCLCRQSGLGGAIDFPAETKLFLNVLPTTIHDPNFQPDLLVRTLEECQLSPSDVVFEISEQESIDSFVHFRELSDQYRRLGFQFALDDTGSGYAGFEELIELQPEFIKIDRSVVSGVDEDPVRQDVLAALLALAEKMGSRMIGEGLDTLEELAMLGELGIHFGQGWLFGHPTPLRPR
ncbi:MAG: EAL domain-containing protein [Deltaproteobacteria bacterium]|nr:EAL domain-containing protein [Deltaproteobacteria bacterium]